MYDALFKYNSLLPQCLMLANVRVNEVERLRDAVLKKDKKYGYIVEVLTRTGGSNRSSFPNTNLIINFNYIKSYDDNYDNTYAHFFFKVDPDWLELIDLEKIYKNQSRKEINLKKMFETEFKEMNIEGTEAYKRAQNMAKNLESAINRNKSTILYMDDIIKED